VEYLIKPAAKIDKLCLKMSHLLSLKELYPVTRMTNMAACIGDQRVAHVSQTLPRFNVKNRQI